MGRSVKRKINVQGENYFWVLDSNRIDGYTEQHIRVHKEGVTKSILYISPYNWNFEIRPKSIEMAIIFAKNKGWEPGLKGRVLYISMNNEGEFSIDLY